MPEKFRKMSISEFFKRNRHIAGFSNPVRSVYQTVKELIENALDATETHGILPDIKMWVEIVDPEKSFIRITVEDNGIGVPPSKVPRAFGQVLFGSKYVERQTRGLFGLGVKAAVLYGQMTTGEPVVVETAPIGSDKRYRFVIKIDTKKNEPIVLEKKELKAIGHGTKVSITLQGDWGRARSKVLEYIARTHTLCPYTEFYVRYPEGSKQRILRLPRVSEKLPPRPKIMKPHPHGVDIETFKHMIDAVKPGMTVEKFLLRYFSGTGERSVKEFLKNIGISGRRRVKGLKKDEIVRIVHELRRFKWRAPPSSGLSPVGVENIVAGLKAMYKPEFVAAVTRRPSAYQGHPFIVEAGIAYGGKIQPSDSPVVLRYANKIPLLYDEGIDVTAKVVKETDWKRYGVEFPAPLVVLVHICSTKVPFHGLGKEAIADIPEIETEIKLAVQDVARKLRRHLIRKRKETEHLRRRVEMTKYAGVIASALSQALGVDKDEVEKLIHRLVERKLSLSSPKKSQ